MELTFTADDLEQKDEIEEGENIAELIGVKEVNRNSEKSVEVKFQFKVKGKILAEYCEKKLDGSNKLSNFIEGMTGQVIEEAVADGFSLDDQVGKLYKVEIKKNEYQGTVYDNVVKIYEETRENTTA